MDHLDVFPADAAPRAASAPTGCPVHEALARVSPCSLTAMMELGAMTRVLGAPSLDDWLVSELGREMARRLGTAVAARDVTLAIPAEQHGLALYAAGAFAAVLVRCHSHRLPDVDNVVTFFGALRDALVIGRPGGVALH